MRIDNQSQSQIIDKINPVTNVSKIEKKEVKDDRQKDIGAGVTDQNAQKRVNEQELIHAIEAANKSVQVFDRKLEFSIHEATKEIMVKVIDTNKDEVIREIPAEKTLDMVAKLLEKSGILVDEKV